MTQPDLQSTKLKSLAKVVVTCTSISLGLFLIIQAQQNANQVVAQDRIHQHPSSAKVTRQPSSSQGQSKEAPLQLFYDRDHPAVALGGATYAVLLAKETAHQPTQQDPKTKRHQLKPDQIRYLTGRAVSLLDQRLAELEANPKAYALTLEEVSRLRAFNKELKSNQEISRAHFAPTSKSMGPQRRQTPSIPLDIKTLASLKKLLGLTQ